MTNKFAPTYRSIESGNYFFGSCMTNGRQRVNLCHFRDAQCPREIYQYQLESASESLERTLSTQITVLVVVTDTFMKTIDIWILKLHQW